MQSAEAVLEAVTPQAVGFDCAPELRLLMRRLVGYANLVRFDPAGRVACAAATVGPDPGRAASAWFSSLRAGQAVSLASAPTGAYASAPAVIASVRETDQQGRFAGVLSAVILLSSLKPDLGDRSLPADTQVALASRDSGFLIRSDPSAFAAPPRAAFDESAQHAVFYKAPDAAGRTRVYAATPLIGGVSIVLSAPTEGVFSWAKLNPWSAVLLPLAAFFCALASVWVVADQVAVRWLHYLDRVAAIYARGRFTVRPVKAAQGPPEIQALAHSLDVMAEAIIARDLSLRESLAQKDALMREIHHRVKNNLQVISSLLNMQQRALADPAARAAISDTRQRIGALALIYRALYQGPDLRRVDVRQFLDELIGQVMSTDSASHPSIKTDLEADALSIDPDKLAPLALFAVEAISNARKHAFAQGGVLHVRFHRVEDMAVLEIADEGSKTEPPVIGAGVGRTLMTAFARQLRGTSDIAPNDAGGMTVRLSFPAPGVDQPEPPASDVRETPPPRRRTKSAA
ncbi:MAG TPA: sensor histidine kinase [Caulobacteraceae bacterium]|nr:sensor histidine kinase [Caulobacteraceae bacterium]